MERPVTEANAIGPGGGERVRSGGASSRAASLRCPRCGYDVSGPVTTWKDACPVEGRCPECGLVFGWGAVFDPLRDVPAWFFELAPKRRVRALISTCLRTLAPWSFWRDVKLSFPVRKRRMGAMAGTVVGGVWLLLAITLFLSDGLIARNFWIQTTAWNGSATVSVSWTFEWWLFRGRAVDALRWPLADVTWRDSNGLPQSTWFVALFLAVTPLVFTLLGESMARARVRPAHVARAAIATATSCVLIFSVIGVLRLIASAVLMGHYFNGLPGPKPAWIWFTCRPLAWHEWPLVGLLIPWTGLSWWFACRRYLRIEHAGWVAFAMTLIGTLAVLCPVLLFTHAFTGLIQMFL